MMIRKSIVSAVLIGTVVTAASPALAPAATVPHLSVDVSSGPPSTPVTVTGTGFCASGCTTVTLSFNGFPAQRGIAVAPDGSFQVRTGVGGGSGTVEILATQQRNPPDQGTIQAFTYFTLTPGAPPPGSTNPAPVAATTSTTTTVSTPSGSRHPRTTTTTVTSTTSTTGASSTTSTGGRVASAAHTSSGGGGFPTGPVVGVAAAVAVGAVVIWYWRRARRITD